MLIFEPETILDTTIEDLHITGEHAIPDWLHEPEQPSIVALAQLDLEEVQHDASKLLDTVSRC